MKLAVTCFGLDIITTFLGELFSCSLHALLRPGQYLLTAHLVPCISYFGPVRVSQSVNKTEGRYNISICGCIIVLLFSSSLIWLTSCYRWGTNWARGRIPHRAAWRTEGRWRWGSSPGSWWGSNTSWSVWLQWSLERSPAVTAVDTGGGGLGGAGHHQDHHSFHWLSSDTSHIFLNITMQWIISINDHSQHSVSI